ncbi:MAG: UvrD-helicase domain-containing protein [Nanoarchaeota archaeon]
MAKKKIAPVEIPGQLDMLELLGQKKSVKYTEEQEKFILHEGKDSVILAATAGSGKTFSCVQRLKTIVERGVDPNRIIFFSFTKAATEELRERVGAAGILVREKVSQGEGVTITTIHAFANSLLARMGKYKEVATFYEFLNWFKNEYRPSSHATKEQKEAFYELMTNMYEDAEQISSAIGAFKLQMADNIKAPMPQFFNDYKKFLRDKKKRDFSDMLIEVRDLLRDNKWLKKFRGDYDYIFIDEYQDTSTIQLQTLLSLNAKYYYMIGDRNQSIYGYSGANCKKLETMLKGRRDVTEMTLSVNFRSDEAIVENSNKYSSLTAVANSKESGSVNKSVMLRVDELVELLKQPGEVVVLVRTNAIIRKLEKELLKKQVPMRYFNFISEDDIKNIRKEDINPHLRGKLNNFKGYFENDSQLVAFIERFKTSQKFITTIHKSKGREFDECVVVNSIAPDVLQECKIYDKLGKKRLERVSFTDKDEESRNIHYVAVSRSRHKLHFMIYE